MVRRLVRLHLMIGSGLLLLKISSRNFGCWKDRRLLITHPATPAPRIEFSDIDLYLNPCPVQKGTVALGQVSS